MDNQELIKRRKATSDHTDDETIWGGPAGDILTGIRNTEKTPAERAIWELVQNARDVSWENEPAVISFERTNEGLTFSHYGKPFSDVSLGSLIKQTSSKVRSDIKTVGKYGTGFLTTHRFGRMVQLSGLLQVIDGEQWYYSFNLPIDRTPDDKDVLKENLQKQYNKVKEWGYDVSQLTNNAHGRTVFKYESRTEAEKEALRVAFEKAPILTPYVLVLNQRYIKEIGFHDELANKEVVYRLSGGSDIPIRRGLSYSLRKSEVTIERNGCCEPPLNIFYLVSNDTDERIDEGVVTAILPIKQVEGGLYDTFLYDSTLTNLYLSLPLIGTEDWGLNFLLHSPLFECENDSRNGLRIVPQGLGLTENDNQRMLDTALTMIKEWLSDSLSQISDRKYLGKVNIKGRDDSSAVGKYYETLQQIWSGYFKDLDLVLNDKQEFIKPRDLFVIDSDLLKQAEKNNSFKKALYAVLITSHPGCVSCERDFLYWCKCINDWDRPKGEMHILGIEQVLELVESLKLNSREGGLKDEWIEHLHSIVGYLIECGNENLLTHAITPNEKCELRPIRELRLPEDISPSLRSILDDIVPEEKGRFIHPQYRNLNIANLPSYTEKEVKDAITQRLGQLQGKVSAKLKEISLDAKESKFDKSDVRWVTIIDDTVLNAVFRLFTMWIDRNADNKEVKLHGLFAEYLGITGFASGSVPKEIFTDCEQLWRTILYEIAYRFERLPYDEQKKRIVWVKRLVTLLNDYKTFSENLDRFMFFPDQTGRLRFARSLIYGVGLDDDLKKYYDEIVLPEGETIKTRLVDDEFAPYMPQGEKWDNAKVAGLIEDEVCKVKGYPDISKYEKKASVLQIVKRFVHDTPDGKQWISYFKLLSAQKSTILVSFAESDDVFKLLLQPEERLNKMSELAANEHCDKLLELAKKALEQKMYDDADMQYKRSLGLYVESYLVKQLQTILRENETIKALISEENVYGEDVQGGQDIIIYLKEEEKYTPIYYIEVKSRWSNRESVEMSKTQLEVSAREKNHYALCVVNMEDYDKEKVFKNEYPKDFNDIKPRIAVITKIGERNYELKPFIQENRDDVHLGGEVKSIVPQPYVKSNSLSFDALLDIIVAEVKEHCGHKEVWV